MEDREILSRFKWFFWFHWRDQYRESTKKTRIWRWLNFYSRYSFMLPFKKQTLRLAQRAVEKLRTFPAIKKHIDDALQDRDIHELVSWSWISFLFKVGSFPIGILISLIISRRYWAEAMWLYWLTLTVLSLVVSIWLLWISAAMPRLLGEARAKKTHQKSTIYSISFLITVLSWAILSGALFFSSEVIATSVFNDPSLRFPLQIASIFLIPLMLYTLNISFLLAEKRIFHSELVSKGIVPLSGLWIIIGSYWLWPTRYIPIRAYLMSSLFWMIYSMWLIYSHIHIPSRDKIKSKTKQILSISIPLVLTALAGLVIIYSDILMIWRLWTTSDVWVLKVIVSFSSILLVVPVIIESILSAKIAELYWVWESKTVQTMLSLSVNVSSFFWLVILCIYVLIWKPMLWFRWPEFIVWVIPLYIYSLWQFINVLSGNNRLYLQTTWNEKILLQCICISGVINMWLNYLLIPVYGLIWTAIASLCSYIIRNLLACIYIYRKDNIYTFLTPFRWNHESDHKNTTK